MDEKAANCTPFAMFAAFCVWDGGEIATDGVMDYITSNSSKLAAGNSANCANNTLNTEPDGTQGCYQVYFYPDVSPQGTDDSAKIAPPGRVPADTVTYAGQAEPWMDMKGNLLEGVLLSNGLFGTRGFGYGFSSVTNHKLQQTTPRYKSGSYGARCMRFK